MIINCVFSLSLSLSLSLSRKCYNITMFNVNNIVVLCPLQVFDKKEGKEKKH